MGNNDWTFFFVFMSLFNTSLGLSNIDKNTEQEKKQDRIEKKLDKIISLLEDKNNERRTIE